ncbi:MAG: hypothetical protein NTW30_04510 [Candidatus Aenigmarchaeota archaeon]|nr:hypothetical protein [Candidatus Aenigmarchaeota archaeon]
MRKITYSFITFLLLFFNSMSLVIPAFCCSENGQKKCYVSGVCCLQNTEDEFWSLTSCRNFNVWVKPEKMMFTLGLKIPVNLYIENKGAYTDSYVVNYEKYDPNIIVDLTGVTPTGSLAPGEIKILYPRIAVLSTLTNGKLVFMINSTQNSTLQNNATLTIMESDYPLSLPDFDVFGLIEILILVVIMYLVSRML